MRSRRSRTRLTHCRTAHEPTRHAASARAVTFGTRASGPQAVLGAGDGPRGTSSLRPRRRVDLLPYALVTPLTLFIVGLALVPAGYTIVASFFRVQALNPPTRFTGLDNFRRLFSDEAVHSSMSNTALYVLIGVTLSTVLAIGMAVTLQHRFAGRSILIAVLILP